MDESQKILPVTRVKRELLDILKSMEAEYSTITMTRNGEPVGVMMKFGKTDVLSAPLLRNIEEANQKIASSNQPGR